MNLTVNTQTCWNDTNCKSCINALLSTTDPDGPAYFGGIASVGYNSIPGVEIKERQKAFFYTLYKCVSSLPVSS